MLRGCGIYVEFFFSWFWRGRSEHTSFFRFRGHVILALGAFGETTSHWGLAQNAGSEEQAGGGTRDALPERGVFRWAQSSGRARSGLGWGWGAEAQAPGWTRDALRGCLCCAVEQIGRAHV